MAQKKSIIIRTSCIAGFAGLLFGLDIAFVNGSLNFIARDFHLTNEASQKIVGILPIGAAIGTIFSGWLSRNFGRKNVLILSGLLFLLFITIGIFIHNINAFLFTRFIIGIAIGVSSFIAPLYLSEISPYKMRGAIVAIYQLMITLGIFLMFISNSLLTYTSSWRIMLSVLIAPAFFMLLSTFILPESPRYLAFKGKFKKAEEVLNSIRNNKEEIAFEMQEIKATVAKVNTNFELLKKPFYIKVIILGILLQTLQQLCGMNAFMYYSGKIFAAAGLSNPKIATVVVGLVNLLTTILAVKYVDRYGRKPILYFGLTLLVISCAVVGMIFGLHNINQLDQYILLFFSLLFIFAFAVSLGPIIWIVCSEIFPIEGRELGVTVTTATNWCCNTIIGSYTLTWFTTFGETKTFLGFGFVSLLGIILVKYFMPETKNVPLEEIEENLKLGKPLHRIGERVKVE